MIMTSADYTELRTKKRYRKNAETITKFNQLTFSYFFTKLIKNFLNSNFNLPFYQFKLKLISEMNRNYCKFINIFSKFNVEHNHCNFNAKKFKKLKNIKKKQ